MTHVAVFHSVLGVRPGVDDACALLRAAGHDVLLVDQYDGRTFDDYAEADDFAQRELGFPELMRRAEMAVRDLDDGFVCLGFSNGGGMSEYVASRRRIGGAVLCSGALPLSMIGVEAWPPGVPVQIHYTSDDPFKVEGWPESVAASVRAAGAGLERFDYPGAGHLFTDASRTQEYDAKAAGLFWRRTLAFCSRVGLEPGS